MADKFTPPKFEIPEEMRDLAGKSVEQARKAFDTFMGATQQAASSAQDHAQAVQAKAAEATQQVVGFAEQNVKAAFEHAQKLVDAKAFDEVVQLQASFLKEQIQAMQSQLKSMGELARDHMTPKK